MIYLRGRESIGPKNQARAIAKLAMVELPVILCHSFAQFFRVEIESPGDPEPIDDNFQLEVNYAYMNHRNEHLNEYFLIDVVEFDRLEGFLGMIEKDKDAIVNIL